MLSNEELKQEIKKFLDKTGMTPTEFGMKAKNDPSLIKRIENGQDIRESGKIRIVEFMANYGGEVQPNDFYKGE